MRSNILVAFIWNFELNINSRRKDTSFYKAGDYLGKYYEVTVNSLHVETKLWPRASFFLGGGGKELWKFQVLLPAEWVKAQYCITLFFTLDLYYSEKLWHLRSWVFVFSYQKMCLVKYLIKTNSDYDSRTALHKASKCHNYIDESCASILQIHPYPSKGASSNILANATFNFILLCGRISLQDDINLALFERFKVIQMTLSLKNL